MQQASQSVCPGACVRNHPGAAAAAAAAAEMRHRQIHRQQAASREEPTR